MDEEGKIIQKELKKLKRKTRKNIIRCEIALQGRPRRRARTILPTKPQVANPNPSNEEETVLSPDPDTKRIRLSDIKKGSDIICVVPTLREDKCLKMPDSQPKVCSGPNCKAFVHAMRFHGTNEKGETVHFECEMCADVMCPLLPTDIHETVVTNLPLIPTGEGLASKLIPPFSSSAKPSPSPKSTSVDEGPTPSKFQMPKDWRNWDPLNIGAAEAPDMNIVKQAMEMFETRPLFHPLPRYNIKHELSLDIMNNIFNHKDKEKKKEKEKKF